MTKPHAGVAEQARGVKNGELSATELCQSYLDRIGKFDEELGCFLHVDGDNALAQARAVDEARASGKELGPLAGVPVALKDVFVTEGTPTTAASKILAGWVPPYDGTAVTKLKEAGAVLLGKLNMDEFAMGSSNENSGVKPCKNPWDTSRVPGGSSGGSAAAVAADLCAASLGTDTGGSIRQPAAFTGTVGIKPTYGRVSRYGVIAFASSLDQVGPITGSVEDAALMLRSIAGFDPRDATSIDKAVPDYTKSVSAGVAGKRIGLPKEYFTGECNSEVAEAVKRAGQFLSDAGATLEEVSLPHTEYAVCTYYVVAPAEASSNLARYDGVRFGHRSDKSGSLAELYTNSRGEGFGSEVKRRIMLGTFALRSGYYDAYYAKAQKVRTLIQRDFTEAFTKVDAILSPVTPTTAFALGEKTTDPLSMYLADIYTIGVNLAGLPGISVPCGSDSQGLPIGAQLIGKPLDEEGLFAAASVIEKGSKSAHKYPEAYA